jgi:hypothetical protein
VSKDTLRGRADESGSLCFSSRKFMHVMLCTRPYISIAIGIVRRYKSNHVSLHWIVVKHILKYLKRTRDFMPVYYSEDLIATNYIDYDFQSDCDSRRSISGYVFTLRGGATS